MRWLKGLATLALWGVMSVQAQNPALPTGLWLAFDDDGKVAQALVRISERDGRLVGHIAEVLDPEASPNEVCKQCPDQRKGMPLKGLQIISNMNASANMGSFKGGLILDPQEGKEYRLEMDYQAGSKLLKLRGYWGPFWRTQVWQRPPEAR